MHKINPSFLVLIALITATGLISSCNSTNYLTMNAVEPAPVYIPIALKRVGIIDQSLPTDKNKTLDDIDKILTAEGKNLDKDGAHSAVLGLYDELGHNTRFTSVKIIENTGVKSPGASVFPSAIPWNKVEEICNANKVDVLFVLSFYDTDTKVTYLATPVELANPLGITIPAIEHQATMTTFIKIGWRIYDPIHKYIRDEHIYTDDIVLSGRGINPLIAVQAIVGRKEILLEKSNAIGHDYALRVIPYSIRVSREYYVRGTENFKTGKRRAQTGNWDGAAELWKKEVSNSKRKIAGRAAYNMAIINEINGDLTQAIDWASKSYTDYKNKLALDYLRILKSRMAKNE
jgi:hypothetical protein